MNHPQQSSPGAFTAGECSYPCPWCEAPNDSLAGEWCNCVSGAPTLSCRTCGVCFCAASADWRARAIPTPAWVRFLERRALFEQSGLRTRDAHPDRSGPVILVVDDDRVVHVVASRVLASMCGTLLHAFDGAEGWSIAREVLPDLVITDALLPKLDGRELSRRIKTDPATRHCRVAVITALYKGQRYRSEAFRHFLVDAYETKPVSPGRLQALATKLLAGRGSAHAHANPPFAPLDAGSAL